MSMIDFDDISQHFAIEAIATQSRRYRAYVQIVVDGRDMTSRLDPYLMSVLVKDNGHWEATVELDDRDGRLDIPPIQATISIAMGWTTETFSPMFAGNINDIEHGFGRRQGGRRMFIHAFGTDQASKVKAPMNDSIGEGAGPGQSQGKPVSFADAAKKFAANAGLTVSVGPTFQNTMRDYWGISNESVMQWFSRHASDLGAWWRIEGSNVVFNGVNDVDQSPILARWGDNLIGWRLRPYAARSTWAGAAQSYFEDRTGKWLDVEKQFGLKLPWGGSGADAIFRLPVPAPNAQVANQVNLGQAETANWQIGPPGHIIINGEPNAKFQRKVQVIGARPGVDGVYTIRSADHSWSRQGYVTVLTAMPDPAATANNIGAHGYEATAARQSAAEAAAPAAPAPEVAPGAFITSVVHNPDGSVTTYYSDGTIKTVTSEGTTTLSPNGDEAFAPATPKAPVGPSGATGGDAQTLPPVIVEPPGH